MPDFKRLNRINKMMRAHGLQTKQGLIFKFIEDGVGIVDRADIVNHFGSPKRLIAMKHMDILQYIDELATLGLIVVNNGVKTDVIINPEYKSL